MTEEELMQKPVSELNEEQLAKGIKKIQEEVAQA